MVDGTAQTSPGDGVLGLMARSAKPATEEGAERLAKMREKRDEVLVVAADLNKAEQVQRAVDEAIALNSSDDVPVLRELAGGA